MQTIFLFIPQLLFSRAPAFSNRIHPLQIAMNFKNKILSFPKQNTQSQIIIFSNVQNTLRNDSGVILKQIQKKRRTKTDNCVTNI